MSETRRRESGPRWRLPLPKALDRLLNGDKPQDGDNLGLWLDKLVRVDENENAWDLRAKSRIVELEHLFCQDLGAPRHWQSPAAEAALTRMEVVCKDVYGSAGYETFVVEVKGRLLIDYGRPSALETSLSLHPVLGCPRIPGSALKGLLRSWLRQRHRNDSTELRALLGAPDAGIDRPDVMQQRGRLVLHDALPECGQFQLAVDVLTPHASEYYSGEKPPAD